MPPQWNAEVQITTEVAKEIINDQFPKLNPVEIHQVGEGWDNFIFLVNQAFIFRFPRREIAVPLLKNEINILPFLSTHLPIAIPKPIYIGKPSDKFPWPFVGYTYIKGVPAGEAQLNENQRIALAKPIAHFLKTLHEIPIQEAMARGIKLDEMDRLNIAKREPKLRHHLSQLADRGIIQDPTVYYRFIPQKNSNEVKHALLHGDFYFRNFLVIEDRLSGVIDWGDVHIGNPAMDLTIAFTFLPMEGRRIFFEYYGKVDEHTYKIARFRALYAMAMLTVYGVETSQLPIIKEGKRSLIEFLQ